jgi:hypothetical protein
MLSPHEFAVLMLINDAPDQIEEACSDLAALLERRFVSFDTTGGNPRRPILTEKGETILRAAFRYRPGRSEVGA